MNMIQPPAQQTMPCTCRTCPACGGSIPVSPTWQWPSTPYIYVTS